VLVGFGVLVVVVVVFIVAVGCGGRQQAFLRRGSGSSAVSSWFVGQARSLIIVIVVFVVAVGCGGRQRSFFVVLLGLLRLCHGSLVGSISFLLFVV
jgi:hypothetical protein